LTEGTVNNVYIIATTKDSDMLTSKGLNKFHAYRVIQCYENKSQLRILQIKNMWSSKSWIGDFCPNSSKWNEA